MNGVDAFLLLLLGTYAAAGYLRGFIRGMAVLASIAITASGTWWLFPEVVRAAAGIPSPGIGIAAGLALLVLGLYAGATRLFRPVLRAVPPGVQRSPFNRLLGVLIGIADGALLCALGLVLVATLPTERVPREAIESSRIGAPLLAAGSRIQSGVLDRFGPALGEFLPDAAIEPSASQRVKLPFHISHGVIDPIFEREMAARVNAERASRGLAVLRFDDRLRDVARGHSRDMLERGYFSHTSPEGKSVVDRMARRGLDYAIVGENLALAPTLALAHDGLMNSPGHRANILRPEFRRLGIGAIVARPYGTMVTQVFVR